MAITAMRFSRPVAFALALLCCGGVARAQLGDGGGGAGAGGVTIDAAGGLTVKSDRRLGSRAEVKRRQALAGEQLPADLNRASDFRKVSLVKLEAALADRLAKGETPTDAMANLAGLTRIDYVFVVPAAAGEDGAPTPGDVILAGPAGGFAPDGLGRVVNAATGRPTVKLADFLTAVRSGPRLSCSIDPVPARRAQMARAAAGRRPSTSLAGAAAVYRQLADILGLQNIRVEGVPAGSPFGVKLVEADYRLKLFSLKLEPTGVRGLPSYLDVIRPGGDSAKRWELVPSYQPVVTNADRTAFALTGPRVRLLSRDEVIGPDGVARDAGDLAQSEHAWANLVSSRMDELAAAKPAFAALQNLFDLAILTELVKRERLADRTAWPAALFRDPGKLPVPEGNAPKTVPTAYNTKTVGGSLVIGLISGGVSINPAEVLAETSETGDSSGTLSAARDSAVTPPADADSEAGGEEDAVRWWWD